MIAVEKFGTWKYIYAKEVGRINQMGKNNTSFFPNIILVMSQKKVLEKSLDLFI